jgi:hypothetical protein
LNCQAPLHDQSHGSEWLHQAKYFSKLHSSRTVTLLPMHLQCRQLPF